MVACGITIPATGNELKPFSQHFRKPAHLSRFLFAHEMELEEPVDDFIRFFRRIMQRAIRHADTFFETQKFVHRHRMI